MRNEGEPSVEEILESIKKVIARDDHESSLAPPRRAVPSAFTAPRAAPQERVDPPVEIEEEVLDLAEENELFDPAASRSEEGLTNEASARSMRESLAALAMMSEPGAKPQIVRSGETSLEGLVREMLRPMLAQWLDENLPEIVERLVKAEITRIAHKER